MSREEEAVLDKEVQDLLLKNAIELSSNWGVFSQLFTVPKKGGGHRPIINLKRLNSFLEEAFQNGRDQYPQGYPIREGLDGKIGPLRCLSDGAHSPQGQEIPTGRGSLTNSKASHLD